MPNSTSVAELDIDGADGTLGVLIFVFDVVMIVSPIYSIDC
jgi:hypothetical protein